VENRISLQDPFLVSVRNPFFSRSPDKPRGQSWRYAQNASYLGNCEALVTEFSKEPHFISCHGIRLEFYLHMLHINQEVYKGYTLMKQNNLSDFSYFCTTIPVRPLLDTYWELFAQTKIIAI